MGQVIAGMDMAHILLIDADDTHAITAASVLERGGRRVTIIPKRRGLLSSLGSTLATFNVIILEFSGQPEDWDLLDEISTESDSRVDPLGRPALQII